MISALYLVLAALHALVWSWGARAWERAGRPAALTLVLVPATLLWSPTSARSASSWG